MRIEYCCAGMKELYDAGMCEIEDDKITWEGWEFSYCPFCGEKIAVQIGFRNEKEAE